MTNEATLKTYHAAELYAEWTKRGGTLEGWKTEVAPLLKVAGAGPLYKMSTTTFDSLFVEVK
jgi:hypothetical protein